ncbi:hypothetical protein FQR65_LT01871 [Abscondita terminalis]|nr:hypothetical protein FQR65_LT01871 [Abscondita terminalis]
MSRLLRLYVRKISSNDVLPMIVICDALNFTSTCGLFLVCGKMLKYSLTPDRTWNVDETGVTTVQKILFKRGKTKWVNELVKAPVFIIPRKRMIPEFMDNSPIGSPVPFHNKSWMDQPTIKDATNSCYFKRPGVIILCLPPHEVRRYLFIGYYDAYITRRLKIIVVELSACRKAFEKASNGFCKTDI